MQKELKIKISVDKKTGAIKVVSGEFETLKQKVGKVNTGLNNTEKSMEDVTKSGHKMNGMMFEMAKGMALFTAFDFVIGIPGSIIKTSMDFESLKMSLESATGSTLLTNDALRSLKKSSNELGLSFSSSLSGFTALSAAAKQTSLEGDGVSKIFRSVQEASAIMGLSLDDQNGVFRALGQMMSKGKIQAEELRGQLGERLPGAFQIASRAMGMTTSELDKFMSSGKLLSEDFLPKFAAELSKEMGSSIPDAVKTARAEQNRFNNSVYDLSLAIGNSGLDDFTKEFYKLGTGTVDDATQAIIENKNAINEFGLDAIRIGKLVANGYQSIYLLSKLGYTQIAYEFKSEIQDSLNYVLDSFTEASSYWSKTWVGKKIGIEKLDFGKTIIDANALKNSLSEIKQEIQKVSISSNSLMDDILNDTQEYRNELKAEEAFMSEYNKGIEKAKTDAISYYNAKISKSKEYKKTIVNEELYEIEFMKEYNSAQTKANDKFKIKLDLYKQGLASITTPLEKVNSKYLKIYDVVKDIFDEKKLKKFYKVWGSEAQNASASLVTKKDKPKIESTFQDWGKTLNSSISNSLVSALTNADVIGAVKGLGASISSSMIQSSISNIAKGDYGKDSAGKALGIGSKGGIGGIVAGVGISLIMSEVFKKRQSAEEIATQTLSKFNSEITDATKSLSSFGLSGSAFIKQIQMLTDKMNAEQNAGGYALSGKINNEIIDKINRESLSVFDINKVTLSQASSKINSTYYANGKQGGNYDGYNKQNSVAYSKFDIGAYKKLKEELQTLMLKGNNNALNANGLARRKEILSSSIYGIGKDLEKFISIVDEASKKSKENISAWNQRNETATQTAQRLAFAQNSLNVINVSSAESLKKSVDAMYTRAMADGILTDAELTALTSADNLSKSLFNVSNTSDNYIKSINDATSSMQSFIDKITYIPLSFNNIAKSYSELSMSIGSVKNVADANKSLTDVQTYYSGASGAIKTYYDGLRQNANSAVDFQKAANQEQKNNLNKKISILKEEKSILTNFASYAISIRTQQLVDNGNAGALLEKMNGLFTKGITKDNSQSAINYATKYLEVYKTNAVSASDYKYQQSLIANKFTEYKNSSNVTATLDTLNAQLLSLQSATFSSTAAIKSLKNEETKALEALKTQTVSATMKLQGITQSLIPAFDGSVLSLQGEMATLLGQESFVVQKLDTINLSLQSNPNAEIVATLKALRDEVAQLRADNNTHQSKIVKNTSVSRIA